MNERGKERTAAVDWGRSEGGGRGQGVRGEEGACLLTLARVLKERWGGGGGPVALL